MRRSPSETWMFSVVFWILSSWLPCLVDWRVNIIIPDRHTWFSSWKSLQQARSQGGHGPLARLLCPPRSLLPNSCQSWYSTSTCELFCVFHQVPCKWYSCLAKFWHLYIRTAAEWDTETSDNLQCRYCLKKILVKFIKICKFLSDSNKEAKCARLWIFSVFYKLLTYMGDGSIISAIAVPLALSRVPLCIF